MKDKQYRINIFVTTWIQLSCNLAITTTYEPNLLPINSPNLLINIYLTCMPRPCGTYGTTFIVYNRNWYMVNK